MLRIGFVRNAYINKDIVIDQNAVPLLLSRLAVFLQRLKAARELVLIIGRDIKGRGVPFERVVHTRIRAEAIVVRSGVVGRSPQVEHWVQISVSQDQIVEKVDIRRGSHQPPLTDKRILINQNAGGGIDKFQRAASRGVVSQVLIEVERSAEDGLSAQCAAGRVKAAIAEYPYVARGTVRFNAVIRHVGEIVVVEI